MISKFHYGTPVETFAVVEQVPLLDHEELRRFTRKKGSPQVFSCPLGEEDIVYGLGETMRGINKRGARYISFNYDDGKHRDDICWTWNCWAPGHPTSRMWTTERPGIAAWSAAWCGGERCR